MGFKGKIKTDLMALGACLATYAVIQGLITADIISPFWQLNIILIGINIILAVSLNLINGFTGQFSIGHAGFMAVGAYLSAVLTVKMQLPFLAAIAGGAIGAAVLGFAIGLPTLRLTGDYLAIATLGLGEIIRICILNIQYVGGASGFMGISRYTNFTWVFFLAVLTIFVIKNFIDSTHGRACISIRENEIAAEAMGVDTTKYKVLAFTIGAGFAGVAGALFSHYFYIAHPASFTFMRSFDILTMVVLGGLGSITGSITGAVLLTFVSAALASYPEWRMVIYALSLIILMIYRPQGLFGNKEISLKMLSRLIGGGRRATQGN
ncbi:MAG TPA: branched-chain amino acid ABC transporter permease [Methylomusa anaerophila]|uniref:High-affinity branched-chain amino acid transport system permease protein LivH n=1 Tax=Methylomusa anaerophila TaxID=1930071 RepID=A0A348AHQ3_9FIRM|nr:branched-chain amino acid ABC transporter permease [Methylomusa anaerophila]BBB90601.1 high-affinity branched-chain amino acid transport system permease protein LivH [Methylomusa anaerophila]HML88792.1 branched-chain amino acid ABC transporter permease [Methylomusa anaerophila]